MGNALYNVFLHPLRAYPGPLLWRISPIPRALALARGKLVFKVTELTTKYGRVVRIGPNELAYSDADAWNDIYGHRKGGAEEWSKQRSFYHRLGDEEDTILFSGREKVSGSKLRPANPVAA